MLVFLKNRNDHDNSDKPKHAVTHIGWPLNATRIPKPAKECVCPARERNFQNALHATEKKDRTFNTDKYELLNWLTL